MKRIRPSLAALALLGTTLAGCSTTPPPAAPAALAPPPEAAAPAPVLVGDDRDAHGCIASEGYAWCARESACLRPWELARDKGLANSVEAVDLYCTSGDR